MKTYNLPDPPGSPDSGRPDGHGVGHGLQASVATSKARTKRENATRATLANLRPAGTPPVAAAAAPVNVAATAAALEARLSPPPAKPPETLASFIAAGGEGIRNVGIDSSLQLVVDTPEGATSSRAVDLSWLRVDAPQIMNRIQIVSVDRSKGTVFAGDSVAASYLAPGTSSATAADPTFDILAMTPKLLATTPIDVSREVLAVEPEAQGWLNSGVLNQLRRAIIREILIGDGSSGHVQGIVGHDDVEVVASPGALSALTFSKLEGLKALAVANQVEDRRGDLFVLSDSVASKLSKTALQTGTSRRLLERLPPGADGVPRSEVGGLGEGYRASDLTDNVALYGNLAQVVLGIWSGDMDDANSMYVVVNPFVAEPRIRITAYVSFDVVLMRGNRFATATYT